MATDTSARPVAPSTHIENLIARAANTTCSQDAMRFSQAAHNAAQAASLLGAIKAHAG